MVENPQYKAGGGPPGRVACPMSYTLDHLSSHVKGFLQFLARPQFAHTLRAGSGALSVQGAARRQGTPSLSASGAEPPLDLGRGEAFFVRSQQLRQSLIFLTLMN
jgi:hypothetical protein